MKRPRIGSRIAWSLLLAIAAMHPAPAPASAAPAIPGAADIAAFRAAHGPAWTLDPDASTGRPRRLAGGAFALPSGQTSAADPRLVADVLAFLDEASSLLQIDLASLRLREPGPVAAGGPLVALHFAVTHGGVPLEGADVAVAVSRGRVIGVHVAGSDAVAGDPVPRLTSAAARERALAAAGLAGDEVFDLTPRLAFLRSGAGHRLAYAVTLVRREQGTRHVAWIDATGGDVISLTDETIHACAPPPPGGIAARVVGGVRMTGARDPEIPQPLSGVGAGAVVSDAAGLLPPGAPGAAAARLDGPLVQVECVDCGFPEAPAAGRGDEGDVDFGAGGIDATGNGFATPADRTAFFHAERVHRQASRWLTLPWLAEPLSVRTNLPSACNAFWNGVALNFFRSSPACSNTGEIRDVISHEWGHGLDENDGLPPPGVAVDAATGEAVADIVALLRSRDACIGESFFLDPADWPSAGCSGVRDLDERAAGQRRGVLTATTALASCPASTFYRGPLGREGHCEGEILGQAFWHLVRTLSTGASYGDGRPLATGLGDEAAWQVAEALFYRSRPLMASHAPSRLQSLGMSAHEAFTLADDEGDGLASGTPHAWAIEDAFAHHEIEELPSIAPVSPPCTMAAPALTLAPVLDAATGRAGVSIAWTDAGAGAPVRVLRDDADGAGFQPVAPAFGPGPGAFDDLGVLPGRAPRYVVVAEHAGGCLGVSNVATAPALPALRVVAARIDDSVGGDGDLRLEAGETVDVLVDLANDGGAPLSNVSATLESDDPSLAIVVPGPVAYGTLGAGATLPGPSAFRIRVALAAPDVVRMVVAADADEGCLRAPWLLRVARPALDLVATTIDDATGDRNGALDPGERADLIFRLVNAGAEDARGVDGTISFRAPPPAGVTITRAAGSWPDIAVGAAEDSGTPGFTVDATAAVPRGAFVQLTLAVSIGGTPHRAHDVDLVVGGIAAGSVEWELPMGTIPGLGTGEIVNQAIAVQTSDDDGDGRITGCDVPDIVVETWNVGGVDQIVVLSGDDGRVLQQFPVTPCRTGWSIFQSLAAADIDGDGVPEILTDEDGRPCAFELDGTLLWKTPTRAWVPEFLPGRCAAAPQIWDLDGDGSPEIVIGRAILEGATGAVRYTDTTRRDTGRSLVGDIDLDGRLEIISYRGEVRRGDGSLVGTLFPGAWQHGGLVNLDADPQAEVIYVAWADQPEPTVVAREHDGTFKWEWIPDLAHDMRAPPCFGDFDGDGRAEMAMPAGGEMIGIDDDGSEMWRIPVDDSSGASGCSVFDFDGDGRKEIAFRGETLLRVVHGETGITLWQSACRSVTHYESPIIADVDADGRAELVIHQTAGGNTSTLRVYGHPSWPGARGVWNQDAYAVSHVEEDGTATRNPAPRWLTGNDYRGQGIGCACGAASLDVSVDLPCGVTVACFAPSFGGTPPYSVTWDFGDGTPVVTDASPCHEYTGPGSYVGRATVVDAAGCRGEAAFLVEVPEALQVSVTGSPACRGETCFTALVSGGVPPYETTWSFDADPPVAGSSSACHDFAGPGWSWGLAVRDARGCIAEASDFGAFPVAPADVGGALRVRDHSDPWGADIEATLDWSLDFGAPRPAGDTFLLMRGTSPVVLSRIPGTDGFDPVTYRDSTPAAAARPFVHFYVLLAEDPCGGVSAE